MPVLEDLLGLGKALQSRKWRKLKGNSKLIQRALDEIYKEWTAKNQDDETKILSNFLSQLIHVRTFKCPYLT